MTDRTDRFPSANSPQLVMRLLETVARGIRSVVGLQEALGVQATTVRNYLHAARWLGLAEPGEPVQLSPLGLSYVYGGPRRQAVYVQAVWSNPIAADLLLAGDGRLPTVAQVERVMQGLGLDLAAATIQRRASAVRGLIAPAIGRARAPAPGQAELQMSLPLGHSATAELGPPPPAPTTNADDPDVYRFVWAHLLDHGELTVHHIRTLLARAGSGEVSVSGVAMRAQARGDAAMHGDRLVATAASVSRRDLSGSTSSVILSDPGYRAYLRYMRATGESPETAQSAAFASWDERLFGGPARPDTVEKALEGLLLERTLESFPLARGDALAPPVAADPFLDTWALPGLPWCVPPTLSQLLGGVDAVERLIGSDDDGPSVLSPTVVFHGGLLHPLEKLPESLGGVSGLRGRAVRCCPAISVLVAMLLLHRRRPTRFSIVHGRSGWGVQIGVAAPRPFWQVVERFAEARRWVLVRRPGGLGPSALVQIAEAVGTVSIVGRQAVLSEALAVELASQVPLAEPLGALADALAAFVDDGGTR